ncbi:MAG: hypothetical protein ACLQDV_29830 [Candidatus Binataceae bacterium]
MAKVLGDHPFQEFNARNERRRYPAAVVTENSESGEKSGVLRFTCLNVGRRLANGELRSSPDTRSTLVAGAPVSEALRIIL